jgi:intein/homing endonuclease
MTTNKIQEQLEKKSKLEIEDLVTNLVWDIRIFKKENTGNEGRGIDWHSKYIKPTVKYAGETMPDPWDFLDWDNLRKLFRRNLEEAMLDRMVEQKANELIKKMELL